MDQVKAGDQVKGDPTRGGGIEHRVAVIVPTYRSRSFLPACLGSLEAQVGVRVEIIVSDNDSDDGSVAYIREHHPRVRLIENGANLGFSAAVNRGLAKAGRAPFIAPINPDTHTRSDCLARLVDGLIQTGEAGIAAPRMMSANNPDRIDNLGLAVTSVFGQVSIGGGRESFTGFNEQRFVPAACGGGMLFRSEVFQAIGGFDEDYFLCWEDLEFCFRAYRSGFKCLHVPEAVLYHASTAIMGHWSRINVFHYCRGALPTACKLLPMHDLIALFPLMTVNRFKIAVLYAKGGRLITALEGELSSIPFMWRMRKKRRFLPPRRPGFRLKDLLREGDRIRKAMKCNDRVPSDRDREGEG